MFSRCVGQQLINWTGMRKETNKKPQACSAGPVVFASRLYPGNPKLRIQRHVLPVFQTWSEKPNRPVRLDLSQCLTGLRQMTSTMGCTTTASISPPPDACATASRASLVWPCWTERLTFTLWGPTWISTFWASNSGLTPTARHGVSFDFWLKNKNENVTSLHSSLPF